MTDLVWAPESGSDMTMKSNIDDETYCLEKLGIKNAGGRAAEKLRGLSINPSRQELMDLPLTRARYLVVDLETTGMKPGKSRIIEVGAVEVDGFTMGRELASLVYPGVPVPRFISSLTGIENSMVISAPRIEEILPVLDRMMAGRVLVAHNLSFDHSFLREAWDKVLGARLDVPAVCTVKLSRRVYPELSSHNLDSLAGHLRIRPPGNGKKARHRALGDARITAAALVMMAKKLEQEGFAEKVSELIAFQNKKRNSREPDTG